MAGAHRSASPAARRPMAYIMGALFTGSAVMFAAAVVPDSSQVVEDGGVVAGPRSESEVPATKSAPEVASAPQDDAPRPAWDEGRPALAWQPEGTATGPAPTKPSAREVPLVSDETTGQNGQWAPSAPPDWTTSLWEALAQRTPAYAEPAPTPAAQRPPTADDADESDGGLVEDLLGNLGVEF